ncbi:MAG: succinate--CoA ligase [Betaproteobacteria bacterium RIFCSPLOWO2_02_FULL_67_26]|nr:MAG: succinate--CoA ligase [Betaproteobacteria bacterium RIFCSPLOWO2_02_FULL_67_26]
MNFEEHAAKPLLARHGIAVPKGGLARTPDEAATVAGRMGAVVVKAQVPAGKRGKAGGIKRAATPEEARAHARAILGMEIAGFKVEKVLIEEQVPIERELYAAVLNDNSGKGPLVMFSTEGGMDIEEVAAAAPAKLRLQPVDIRRGFSRADGGALVQGLGLGTAEGKVADALAKLYEAYAAHDAELLEINPLIVARDGRVVALDCKFVMDDCGIVRHLDVARAGAPEQLTGLEARARAAGLKYIDLDGDVGVLANGAGLTMTTMDVIRHYGGRPANFLEIGGESYTQAKPALELLLSKPGIKSLVINFCGAFARTDVMAQGVIEAIEALKPGLPIYFSVHGTGDVEAIKLLKDRLGVTPLATMNDACQAAVRAAA